MKNKNILGAVISCLLVSVLFISCDSNEIDVRFIPSKTYRFSKPEAIGSNRLFLYENAKQKLIIQAERVNDKIVINDLENNCIKEWKIKTTTPWNTLYALSPDSILLFHSKSGQFQLIDSNSNILDSFSIPLLIDSVMYGVNLTRQSDLIFYGDYLIIPTFGVKNDRYIYDFNIDLIYNIRKKQLIKTIMKFPKCYTQEHNWSTTGFLHTKTIINDCIYYNFPAYENIIEYNLSDDKQKDIKMEGSKYFSKFPPTPISPDWQKKDDEYFLNYHIDKQFYSELIFDKYRKLFYRIVVHPQPLLNKKGKKNSVFTKNWSIMVFDKEFNFISEQYFKGSKYLNTYIFISRDGLIVTLDDKYNVDKGGIAYQLFKIDVDKK